MLPLSNARPTLVPHLRPSRVKEASFAKKHLAARSFERASLPFFFYFSSYSCPHTPECPLAMENQTHVPPDVFLPLLVDDLFCLYHTCHGLLVGCVSVPLREHARPTRSTREVFVLRLRAATRAREKEGGGGHVHCKSKDSARWLALGITRCCVRYSSSIVNRCII